MFAPLAIHAQARSVARRFLGAGAALLVAGGLGLDLVARKVQEPIDWADPKATWGLFALLVATAGIPVAATAVIFAAATTEPVRRAGKRLLVVTAGSVVITTTAAIVGQDFRILWILGVFSAVGTTGIVTAVSAAAVGWQGDASDRRTARQLALAAAASMVLLAGQLLRWH